jgi:glutamate synthase domain-containing protein 2
MSYTKVNASAATLSKNRTEDSITSISGMCATCVDGCIGMCEIGKSAYRGVEMIYPQPFGIITAASEKDYPIDYGHLTILGTAAGAHGIEEDSDKAIFPNVTIEREIGADNKITCSLPFIIAGMGSTNVAAQNWDGLAIGAAISGVPLTIGENVVGMDMKSEIKNGRVVRSPGLESRVKPYHDWQIDGKGKVILQGNIEDTRLGVQEYAIEKLGVEAVELKWGQGAKDIGGEVKISNLEKAQELYKRGYVVLPNPTDEKVIEAFNKGIFHEFERHSRVGMISEESFMQRVEELRAAGAKHITLKTGAYRPIDLARAIKWSSMARLDLLTVDGAGGGTGMSPWRMMNEWGVPVVELHSLLWQMADKLAKRGEFVPDLALAGGFTFEDAIFKGLALGAPYVKLIAMARSPLAAAMVGKTLGMHMKEGMLPVYVGRFGSTPEEIFVTAPEIKDLVGTDRFDEIPTGALGVYTYFSRLDQGLRQIMAGARKFNLDVIERDDVSCLTRESAEVTGLKYITEVDAIEVEEILKSQ